MKFPPYRLQTYLDLMNRQRDDARIVYTAKLRRQEEEQAKWQQLETARQELRLNLEREAQKLQANGTQSPLSAFLHTVFASYANRCRDEEQLILAKLEEQKRQVVQAEKETEAARAELQRLAVEVKSLERHKEQWQKQWQEEADRKEDQEQDEIGQILHQRNQKEKC
jgi:flagellar biosynthesis chaperone FliJ